MFAFLLALISFLTVFVCISCFITIYTTAIVVFLYKSFLHIQNKYLKRNLAIN